jgi:hypothetical protein
MIEAITIAVSTISRRLMARRMKSTTRIAVDRIRELLFQIFSAVGVDNQACVKGEVPLDLRQGGAKATADLDRIAATPSLDLYLDHGLAVVPHEVERVLEIRFDGTKHAEREVHIRPPGHDGVTKGCQRYVLA